MFVIPVQTENHVTDAVLVVLETKDIRQIIKGIPLEVNISQLAVQSGRMLLQPNFVMCYEKDVKPLEEMVKQKKSTQEVAKYLARKVRPVKMGVA